MTITEYAQLDFAVNLLVKFIQMELHFVTVANVVLDVSDAICFIRDLSKKILFIFALFYNM
jgi:5-bromo-4-chloroindolyl phosphate hydrolysis protein